MNAFGHIRRLARARIDAWEFALLWAAVDVAGVSYQVARLATFCVVDDDWSGIGSSDQWVTVRGKQFAVSVTRIHVSIEDFRGKDEFLARFVPVFRAVQGQYSYDDLYQYKTMNRSMHRAARRAAIAEAVETLGLPLPPLAESPP